MTLAEIKTMLEGATGFSGKVVYRAWKVNSAPALPFICFLEDGTDNFFADNSVYEKITRVRVELYTKDKDTVSEEAVEAVLSDLCWNKDETYIDSEKCYQITYEIEV